MHILSIRLNKASTCKGHITKSKIYMYLFDDTLSHQTMLRIVVWYQ